GEPCKRPCKARKRIGEACKRTGKACKRTGKACKRTGKACKRTGKACKRTGNACHGTGEAGESARRRRHAKTAFRAPPRENGRQKGGSTWAPRQIVWTWRIVPASVFRM